MSPQELKDHFGDNLAFHGGVSIQQTMPFGSSAEIRREVKRLARTLGRAGGYVFCTAHNIQADTPVESVDVLMEAYRDYGAYS
jgi:uroporphyrinogen decarboxylase